MRKLLFFLALSAIAQTPTQVDWNTQIKNRPPGSVVVTPVLGVATINPRNGWGQYITLPSDGSLVTITIGGTVPVAGTPLWLFIITPNSGTYRTPAFTGGVNQFAADVASRYSVSPTAGTQDELQFTFHGAGTPATMANPTNSESIQ